jgi:ATP-binding cassette subfamily F protein uup
VALAQALVASPTCCCWTSPPTTWIWTPSTWLEELLVAFKGSVVLISHDRAFLDNVVATRIVELDRGQLRTYPGNFTAYEGLKEEQLADEAVTNAKADKLLAQEEVWIRKGVEARRTRSVAASSAWKTCAAQRSSRRDVVGQGQAGISLGDRAAARSWPS